MAGAIWGAYNGGDSIPSELLESTEGVDEMIEVVAKLRKCNPSMHRTWHPIGNRHQAEEKQEEARISF